MPIDTLKASKQLKALGFSDEQAEGLTDLLRNAEAATATKDDLDALERRMTGRFERVDERFNGLERSIDERFNALEKSIDERFARIDERFARVDDRFRQVDVRFDTLEKSINERFARVDKRFEQVDDRFDAMEARFDDRFQQFEATLKNYMTTRIMWAFGLLAVYITLLSYFGG